MAAISRNTLLGWLKEGVLFDVEYRDWRGWRVFTSAQVKAVKSRAHHIATINWRSKGDA